MREVMLGRPVVRHSPARIGPSRPPMTASCRKPSSAATVNRSGNRCRIMKPRLALRGNPRRGDLPELPGVTEEAMHKHKSVTLLTVPFSGPIPNAVKANPVAPGGVTELHRCACGAQREVNVNHGQAERGRWYAPNAGGVDGGGRTQAISSHVVSFSWRWRGGLVPPSADGLRLVGLV